MTLKNKLVLYVLFTVMLFGLFNLDVKAAPGFYEYGTDFTNECVDQKTCVLVCGYENNTMSGDIESTHLINIYYRFDNKKPYLVEVVPYKNINNLFSLEDVNIPTKRSFYEPGVYTNMNLAWDCPEKGYVDNSGLLEVCYDHDGSYCVEKDPGGIGTAFLGESTKTFDIMGYMGSGFENLPFMENFNCDYDELKNSSVTDIEKKYNKIMTTEINTSIIDNVFNGHDIPTFISGSERYNRTVQGILDRYEASIKSEAINCANQIKNDTTLTEEEKDTMIDSVDAVQDGMISGVNETNIAIIADKDNSSSDPGVEVTDDCEGLLGNGEFYNWLQDAFDLIKLAGPILALVLGMMDFIKALASGEDDAKKKATSSFGKRLLAAVLLFLIPAILSFVLSLVDTLGGGTCGIS